MNVPEILAGKRICICVGSGGVGKTTSSAAIAMGMAALGLKVAVVTIDPARRLANSLGLEELDNEPRQVDPDRFAAHGLEVHGELWAMMLDAKRTFDGLIERLAPTPEAAREVVANRIYQQLSGAVAGTQEFTAIAKLYDLDEQGRWDLIVLDTPPSRNALDFLDAPDRLTEFLEGRALQVFLRPAGLAGRVVGRGTGLVFGVLSRVTGANLLDDLSVFFRSIGGMIGGFRERAARVKSLLVDPGTTFLLVTSPEREPIEEAIYFHEKLEQAGMPFGGVVVNRVHHDTLRGADAAGAREALAPLVGEELAAAATRTLEEFDVLARRDALGVERLCAALGAGTPLIAVPHLDDDVHDVEGLLGVHEWLFAPDAEREARLETVTA